MLLSTREKEIIAMLIKYHGQYVTIYDIAQHLAVSSRTVHRELKSIESALANFNITLERVNKKGLQLLGNTIQIEHLKRYIQQHTTVDLSVEEQKVIILYALIQSKESIKQYSLAHEIGVSIQTLTKLLDDLTEELLQYQLVLQKKRGEGIYLNGPESKKRELLSQLMVNNLNSTSVYSVIENHFVYQSINQNQLNMVDMDKIFQVERILMDHLGRLPYTLTESSYLTLTVHIVLSIDRMLNGDYVSLNDELYNDIRHTFEHEIATALSLHLEHIYGVAFNQAEIGFITIHLRGAKRKDSNQVDSSDESEQFPIDTFITQVSRISQISFDNTATLIEGLKLHIIPAINRLKANIETYNPLTDMIKKDYPLLFASVKKALYMVWPKLQFPDSEIGFIVLHFGGAINKKVTSDFHVLVVCSSGIGTSQILAARLQQSFPDITSTTQASVGDLVDLDLQRYAAIVSTVDLDIFAPYITVNPLLPDTDINHVASFMKLQQTQSQQSSELESNINISIQHQDDTLRYIRNGLTLIDNVNIEYTDVTEINDYLTTHLYQQQIINDVQSFADELQQRSLTQNYILDPYPIAIPHLKHRLILRPYILVTILNQPMEVIDDQNDKHTIQYLLAMFAPEDDFSAEIISRFSSAFANHLTELETLMLYPERIRELVKQSYLQELQNKLQDGVDNYD